MAWLDPEQQPITPGHAHGHPDFRVVRPGAREIAVGNELCWICGEKLGAYRAFVIGPMCAINRVSSEPPSHQDCADFSAIACPFLTRPKMERREEGLPADLKDAPGFAISRNLGVAMVWTTSRYSVFGAWAGGGGWLIRLGDPLEIGWYAEGRKATRAEILESINSGLPLLREKALEQGDGSVEELEKQIEKGLALVPAEE